MSSMKTNAKGKKKGEGNGVPPLQARLPTMSGAALPPKVQKDLNEGSNGLSAIQVTFYPQGITESKYLVRGSWMPVMDYTQVKSQSQEEARQQKELHASKGALNKIRDRFLVNFATPDSSEEARRILAIPHLDKVGDGIFKWSQKRFEPYSTDRDALVLYLRPHSLAISYVLQQIVNDAQVSWYPLTKAETKDKKADAPGKSQAKVGADNRTTDLPWDSIVQPGSPVGGKPPAVQALEKVQQAAAIEKKV